MAEIHQFGGSDASSLHTFAAEEKMAFSEHINQCLDFDPILKRHLPLDPNTDDLFTKTSDGLIYCKLINLAVNDTIDERAINKKENMSVYNKAENLNLALNAARSIGCQIVNIGSQDLMDGKPILILGLVWQIIRIQLLSQITLKNCPELVVLLEPEETLAQFMKLPPEHILLRWINYHLVRGGSDRKIKNFSSDIMDSEIYSVLTHELDSSGCPRATTVDNLHRAAQVIRNANHLGARTFIQPVDICNGNKKLNISFCAQIFNANHGLRLTPEKRASVPDISVVDLSDMDEEVSREEIVFRNWINSLNIENVYIQSDLFGALEDGVILIKVIDTVQPGVVNWKKVNQEPASKYKRIENCNYAVEIGKNDFKFSLVGVGGVDVVNQNTKLVLALVWQMLRKYTLNMLSKLAVSQGIDSMSEERIVEWANQKVASHGSERKMKSFKDSSLRTGLFFLDLIAAMEPRAINPDIITPGSTPEECMLNAKYAISVARKIGACVFLSPADITEGKVKMLFTFCASLWMNELLQVSNLKNG